MVTETGYMADVYDEIERVVGMLARHLQRGVLPKDVVAHLPYLRAEGSVRRDMLNMAAGGRLVRMYGEGCRRGYRLPTRMEVLAFRIIGHFPWGANQLKPSAVKCAMRRDRARNV